jgi:hypothetical protein
LTTGCGVYGFLLQKVLETLLPYYKKYPAFCLSVKKAAVSMASIDLLISSGQIIWFEPVSLHFARDIYFSENIFYK